ncbi:MAG: hypothetical protein AB7U82_33675 [Blastocatellales bacterium]
MTKEFTREQLALWTPEELQEFIEIAEEFLVEILQQRGLTVDELRERRKQIVTEEKAEIAAEREKLDGNE